MAPEYPSLASLGRLGFIGTGAVGSTLARALAGLGAQVTAVAAHSQSHAEALAAVLPGGAAATTPQGVADASDVVVLAVPDDAIISLAQALSLRPEQAVVHVSGARPASALGEAARRGARTAALHPLMTFPRLPLDTPVEAILSHLAGCTWALEAADPNLASELTRLVYALDGQIIVLAPADRVPYHIAAVLASNYVVALVGAAVRLWSDMGVPQDDALRALLPLLRGTVESLGTVGLPAALTGPVARGDSGTIAAHLAWLREHTISPPELAALEEAYVALARLALPLAQAKGTLTSQAVAQLDTLLRTAQALQDNDPQGPS
jgi:predicted short-subunit dehydrogenase-like oxidoreductase (DUF2520 family)